MFFLELGFILLIMDGFQATDSFSKREIFQNDFCRYLYSIAM